MSHSYNPEGIEGEIISGEKMRTYGQVLKFDESLLKDKTILNFGCGGSNLSGEIKRKGIECNMVELDIEEDPESEASVGHYTKPVIKIVEQFVQDPKLHVQLVALQRKLSGTEDRTFVQGDGRALPFADETFDITFAMKSVYQVPANERPAVYSELLRVSKAVHVAPVMSSDFETLSKLAEAMGFEIILCGPIDIEFSERVHLPIRNYDDYGLFKDDVPYEQRVARPPSDDVNIISIAGKPIHAGFSGGTMILKRK